jgi:SM-20-related protein
VDAEDGGGSAGLLIEALRAEGLAVRDGFLQSSAWRALAACAAARRARGDFAAARVGAGSGLERRAQIRGDFTCWLRPPLFDPERQLLEVLERLRLELNRGGIPGLFDLELHYAWYPPGAGYARHVDRPEKRDARIISLVLYLNEDWASGDGGALRCFHGTRALRDIQPIGGRLVAFVSEGLEHAVLPARRPRLSLTGWFRGREELPLRQ